MEYQKLNISLRKSKLDNLELKETIDIKLLDSLINSSLLKQTFNNPMSNVYYENEKEQLLKYKKLVKNGYATIKYNQVKDMYLGRVNPKNALGLFSIRREIRHTLARNNFIDIDIENCHPVILLQICQANNIKCDNLNKYVHNRTYYLSEVMEAYNVNRDDAKKLFIRLLYFGTFENWLIEVKTTNNNKIDFLNEFQQEIKSIGYTIMNNNPNIKKLIEKRKSDKNIKDYNLVGSVCSYFLQEYECQILETIYNYCVENNIIENNIAVLCADGLMIQKDKYNDDLLNIFTDLIKDKLEFELKFTTKEMNQGYTIEDINNNQISSPKDYNNIKIEFEKTNFKILNPIAYATLYNSQLIIRNKADFKNVYENLIMDNNKPFINEWLKDSNNKTYSKIDFLPMQEVPDDVYNTFKGYVASYKETIKSDLENSLIIKHLKNLCNNSDDVYKYVIKFLARKLQKPNELTNTALIFKSSEGVGKDLFFNWFGSSILGKDYYINEEKTELIFGKFNSSIENKIIIVLNETSGKDTFQINENIKNAITRPINMIEHKGLKPYENTNNIGYIFLTNNDNPVKVSYTDRRFMAIECNNEYANNAEYIKNLVASLQSGEYDKAFYNMLMNEETDNFDFTNNRPITSFYEDLKDMNKPIISRFLEYLIDNNTYNTKYNSKDKAMTIFNKFKEFIHNNNFKCDYSSTKFFSELKKYEGITKVKLRDSNYYYFNIEVMKIFLITKYNYEFVNFVDINTTNKDSTDSDSDSDEI